MMKCSKDDRIVENVCVLGGGLAGAKVGAKMAQEILFSCNKYSTSKSLVCEFIGGILMGAVGVGLGKLGSEALFNENRGGETDEQ